MTDYKKIMKFECEDRRFTSGVNMLVIKDGKEAIYEEFGYRDLENKVPFSRDTIMRLYSMSKPITAAAVMILADRGLLDLADCICWTLPGFSEAYYINDKGERVKSPQQITMKDLLNMTSGLPYPGGGISGEQVGGIFWEMDQRLFSDNPMTTREFGERMGKVDLCFIPGDKWMYGTSADILGYVVECVSGMKFGEFLNSEIFEPLGMSDTGFFVAPEKLGRLAKVYKTDYANWRVESVVTNHLGITYAMDKAPAFESGGAGLCSTLDDYAKFAQMLLGGGELNGVRILSETAAKYLTSASLTPWQKESLNRDWRSLAGFSYGNLMRNVSDPGQVLHFARKGDYGWDGWLGCYFANCPEENMTILIGMQRVDCGTCALTRKLVNTVYRNLLG